MQLVLSEASEMMAPTQQVALTTRMACTNINASTSPGSGDICLAFAGWQPCSHSTLHMAHHCHLTASDVLMLRLAAQVGV
jgi:hypothetical protein